MTSRVIYSAQDVRQHCSLLSSLEHCIWGLAGNDVIEYEPAQLLKEAQSLKEAQTNKSIKR